MNLPVPELKNDDNIKESSSCPHSSLSLGPYSDNIGFGINDINNYKSFCGRKNFQFTNGSILEIRSISPQAFYMRPFFFTVSNFYRWRKNITPIAKKKFDTILSTRSNLLKNESKLNEFLNSAFQYNLKSHPPQPQTKNHAADSPNFENEMISMKDEISKLILKVTDLQSKLRFFKFLRFIYVIL